MKQGSKIYQFVLAVGAVLSGLLSFWGSLAAMIVTVHLNFANISQALVFLLPLPLFLIALRSPRLSAVLLFANLLGLWLCKVGPLFHTLGPLYLCLASVSTLLAFLKRKETTAAPAE